MEVDNDLQNLHINEIDNIVLSNSGVLALDIIMKEFSNVSNLYFLSTDYINILCSSISDYVQGKEAYLLSYTSKKAIEIIKLEFIYYMNNDILLLQVIRKQLNRYNEIETHTQTNKKKTHKRHNSNSDNISNKKRNVNNIDYMDIYN